MSMDIITAKDARAKGLKEYFTGKPCKNGHISARSIHSGNCKECSKAYSYAYLRSDKYREYDRKRNATPERIAYRDEYNSSDKAKEAAEKYSQSTKGRETARRYRQTEKSKASRRAYHRSEGYRAADKERSRTAKRKEKSLEYGRSDRNKDRLREKYATDVIFRLTAAIRVSLRRALKGAFKPETAIKLLGCSVEDFRDYIEGQFRDGMTWENQGVHWHLDHIKPLSTFDNLSDIEQLGVAQHYTNIQPLLSHENLSKNNNENFCLETYRKENPDRYVLSEKKP